MLEQFTRATASVRQFVTVKLEAWRWGKKERKKKEKSQLEMEKVMGFVFGSE
jgi:hypothetical protein